MTFIALQRVPRHRRMSHRTAVWRQFHIRYIVGPTSSKRRTIVKKGCWGSNFTTKPTGKGYHCERPIGMLKLRNDPKNVRHRSQNVVVVSTTYQGGFLPRNNAGETCLCLSVARAVLHCHISECSQGFLRRQGPRSSYANHRSSARRFKQVGEPNQARIVSTAEATFSKSGAAPGPVLGSHSENTTADFHA
jgi:hypothetical protein